MKKWFVWVCLGVILLIGLSLRLPLLTDVPHGFFADEAAIGYNAYTIAHFGVDEYGKKFPLFFESFGDYKDPVQIYFTVPFVLLLGLTEFSIRLPSVVWGLITILGVFLLTKEIKNSWIASLAAAFAAATMPWLVHYNRVGFELNAYAALWTLTVYFFLKAFKRKIYFSHAAIFLGITLYSYQPAKLLIPLLLLGIVLAYHHILWRHRQYVLMSGLIFVIIALPMVGSFFSTAGTARFAMVSVFSAHLPLDQTIAKIINNYFYQLSPAFFLTGEPTFITRHFVKGLLPLLPVTLPFLAIGLLYSLITVKKASSQLLLWLLLIYPVAGAVVADPPFTSRSVIGAPLFAVFVGIGIALAIQLGRHTIGKVAIASIVSILFLINTGIFMHFYFNEYPLYSSDFWGWQYGAEPSVHYFVQHKTEYDDFGLAGDFNAPDIFLKFYAPSGGCEKCKIALPKDIYDPHRKQLFSLTPDDMTKDPEFTYHTVGQIFYPNNQEAFRLVTVTKN